MGWFSPLKGAYPGLAQIDKTLPVGSTETGIVRGTVLYVDDAGTSPVFRAAGDTQAKLPGAYVFFALQAQDDFQAGMAGTIGQGPAGTEVYPAVARITGLAVGNPGEFQTDQFYAEAEWTAGCLLTVTDGGLLTVHTTGLNVIGQLTAMPFTRRINDKVAVSGRRTGADGDVINFRTMWIPTLTVSPV